MNYRRGERLILGGVGCTFIEDKPEMKSVIVDFVRPVRAVAGDHTTARRWLLDYEKLAELAAHPTALRPSPPKPREPLNPALPKEALNGTPMTGDPLCSA